MPAMAKPTSRTAKTAAKPKASAVKPKAAATGAAHPPYFEMIKEAITALKERTGSSSHAIAKYMEDKHGASLPANYKKMLSIQLRGFAAKGKLVKVKASYKLSDAAKKDSPKAKPASAKPATKPAKASAKPAAAKPATKPAKAAAKPKKPVAAKPKKPAAAGTKRKAPEKKVVAKPKKSPAAKAKAKPKTVKSPASKKARKVSA